MGSMQLAFELPPPAVVGEARETASSYQPPKDNTVKSRRRSSAVNPPKDPFALPPPPTRSRKIIQMKPRGDPAPETPVTASQDTATTSPSPSGPTGAKRKHPSATNATSKKVARKTAHSLIERRRRSKMNEEFAVLKNLVPACTGEMHKLAILQASIEYIRYLEDCVAKLKEQCAAGAPVDSEPDEHGITPTATHSPTDLASLSTAPSPVFAPIIDRSQQPSASPAILPQDSHGRHHSYSSVAPTEYYHTRNGYSTSASTSPSFGAQGSSDGPSYPFSAYGSALTSPALAPRRDVDQEATAALLMLNQMDRRASGGTAAPPRGISPWLVLRPEHYSGHRRQATPPQPAAPASGSGSPQDRNSPPPSKPRTVFTSAKARPLRLVQESLVNARKRRPPVFFANNAHSVLQDVSFITIYQTYTSPSASPLDKMAAPNPLMPKVDTPSIPSLPGTSVRPPAAGPVVSSAAADKDKLLADLRRQLDDSASDASSVDSRGRRRRRNNKQLARGGLTDPAILPRLADTKPVRLQLGLNLDVELELKARLQGDVSLTLLIENNPSKRPSSSTELRCDPRLSDNNNRQRPAWWFFGGGYYLPFTNPGYHRLRHLLGHSHNNESYQDNEDDWVDYAPTEEDYAELAHMRLGKLRLRQRWVDRESGSGER
ncbi:hypothetical protein VTJ49DRAFT_3329 [Mycothermus thermophilus]|uniref:BHLH domain-containing protein n=1 Tax=Humicola insolens TaxID=85995 RepID=A0ABR3VM99_HUMIN